jgi:hypothetical protein
VQDYCGVGFEPNWRHQICGPSAFFSTYLVGSSVEEHIFTINVHIYMQFMNMKIKLGLGFR